MRPIHALPLIAALALAACGDDTDAELTDEALSAEEVASIEDNGNMPAPGEYTTDEELIEFDAPGLSDEALAEARAEFAAGAEEPLLFCVTEETTREQWLSDMTEANCTLSRLAADGNNIDGVMQCSAEEGLNGRIEVAGTAGPEGSDLRLTVPVQTAAGEGTVRMRVRSERVGDCG